MGLNGYMVHNNFVYKSTSPNILTYSIILLVIVYIIYLKIWPLFRRLTTCALRVAVNMLKTYAYHHPSLLQVYRRYNVVNDQPSARFKARYKRVSAKDRAAVLTSIREWEPPTISPLTIDNQFEILA